MIHRTRRLHRANKPADPPPSEQAVIVGSPETYSRTFRSWPLLILAFGVLIALMIGGDLATMDRARRLHDAISEVNETYQKSAQRLEQLRAGIHLSSLLLRDYLLDPRAGRAVKYRDQMTDLRKRIDEDLVELDNSMPSHESDKVHEMQRELNEYWDSLDPVFALEPSGEARVQLRISTSSRDSEARNRSWACLRCGSFQQVRARSAAYSRCPK